MIQTRNESLRCSETLNIVKNITVKYCDWTRSVLDVHIDQCRFDKWIVWYHQKVNRLILIQIAQTKGGL